MRTYRETLTDKQAKGLRVMTYNGRIKAGGVVFDEPVQLPEGAVVEVSRIEPKTAENNVISPGTLRASLAELDGTAEGLPCDLAKNHDHYLHGLPKR